MLSFLSVEARRIDVEKAEKVARSYARITSQLSSRKDFRLSKTVTKRVARQHPAVRSTDALQQQDEPMFYVFAMNENGGFIIVSGDDVAKPVLGYSDDGTYDENNPNFAYWMEMLSQEIAVAIENNVQQNEQIKAQWAAFENDKPVRASGDYVEPLVKTKWNQSAPYNNLCPEISGTRTVTGCVATAMAQIMKYHEYPTTRTATIPGYTTAAKKINISQVTGTTTYDWKNMTDTYTSSSTGISADAVAALMYHCGVSVKMDYDTNENGGSGASTSDVIPALKNYFSYDNGIAERLRDRYSYPDWINMLKTELKAKRPVLYSGQRSVSGHAFVCDGYDTDDKFHINWGWGGYCDGYFEVSALNPEAVEGGTDGYNRDQRIITGIKPGATLIDAQTPVITAQPQSATYTFGATATALSVTANVADGGVLSYQWYSNTSESNTGGTEISEATASIYTHPIVVGTTYYYVIVTNTNTGENIIGLQTVSITSSVATVRVDKASQAAPKAPTSTGITPESVTLTAVAGEEYSKDGVNWQDSPTFDGLIPDTPYTFYARMKETDTHNASPVSAGLQVRTKEGTEANLVNLMVNGNPVSISGNELDYYQAECNETSVDLNIESSAGASATVSVGDVKYNDRPIPLSEDLTVISIDILSGNRTNTKSYKLTVANTLDADSVLFQRWEDVVAVNRNPANNGGKIIQDVCWYKSNDWQSCTEWFIQITEGEDYHTEIKIADKWRHVCGDAKKYSKTVTAYPNPVSIGENLTLRLPGNFIEGYMDVISLSGLIVKHKLPLSDTVNTVSIADLAPGIYLLNVVAPDGDKELIKIIVSN
jgi:hypothetical protein